MTISEKIRFQYFSLFILLLPSRPLPMCMHVIMSIWVYILIIVQLLGWYMYVQGLHLKYFLKKQMFSLQSFKNSIMTVNIV